MRAETTETTIQSAYRTSVGDFVLIVGTAAIMILAFLSAIR